MKYIRPALEELMEVQRTGDIFFPRNWVGSLLEGHSSRAAYNEIFYFFQAHQGYSELLSNKILQAQWNLQSSLNEPYMGFIPYYDCICPIIRYDEW